MSLQILLLLSVLTSKIISKTILRKHQTKKGSWETISPICKIDFDDKVRFFAADAFRVCNERSCPMVGEPGPFGGDCRRCCLNKKNETGVVVVTKRPGISLFQYCLHTVELQQLSSCVKTFTTKLLEV